MKIGIIVDGSEEQSTFGIVVSKIQIEGIHIVKPLYASIAPKATPLQIAKAAESRIKILHATGVQKIIVSIDLEDLNECPGSRAKNLEEAFSKLGYKNISVVIKNRKFENWIIADIDNLKGHKLFNVSNSMEGRLKNCDSIQDAVKELNKMKGVNGYYHKTKDGNSLAKSINPLNIAANSRSFRRFMKLIGHPNYLD